MYTVSILHHGKECKNEFKTEREATSFACAVLHLDPILKDPSGKSIPIPCGSAWF